MRIYESIVLLFVTNLSCEYVIVEITTEAIIDFGINDETVRKLLPNKNGANVAFDNSGIRNPDVI